MSMIAGVVRWLRGDAEPLYPIELKMLRAVASALSPVESAVLLRQIPMFNKIQRQVDGREVNLYHSRGGKVSFDDSLRFPDRTGECRLANVSLQTPHVGIAAEIWAVNGRVFSIVYSKAPRAFFESVESDPGSITINVQAVPSLKSTASRAEAGSPAEPEMDRWRSSLGTDVQFFRPLDERSIDQLIGAANASFPDDYLRLLRVSNGISFDGGRVLGANEIRTVADNSGNLCVIAELGARHTICVSIGGTSTGVQMLDEHGQIVRSGDTLFDLVVEGRRLAN